MPRPMDDLLLPTGLIELSVRPNGRTSVELQYKDVVQTTPSKRFVTDINFFTAGGMHYGFSRPMIYSECVHVANQGYEVYRVVEGEGIQFYGYGGFDDEDNGNALVAFANAVDELNVNLDNTRKNVLLTLGSLDPQDIDIRQKPGFPSNPTALSFPNGALLGRTATGFASSGVVGDFSFGAWFRIDDRFDRYVTLFALQKTSNPGESGSYFWFGYDSQAGPTPGSRGLAIAGPGGSHCYEVLPAEGTWFHAAVTKTGNQFRTYLNGVICTHDSAGGAVTADVGSGTTYDDIDYIYLVNEGGWNHPGHDGAVAAAFLTTNVLDATAIQTAMTKTSPLSAGAGNIGSWPLTGPTNLVDNLGGASWSLVALGPLTSSTGPSAIVS